jgi:hypothetical protein
MPNDIISNQEIKEIISNSYVLWWRHGSKPSYTWYLRGILPDHSFYGELLIQFGHDVIKDGVKISGKAINVECSLSESDYEHFLFLVNKLDAEVVGNISDEPWEGAIAEGPVNHPRIIFRYRSSAESVSDTDRAFLEIIDILMPYMQQFYEALSLGK